MTAGVTALASSRPRTVRTARPSLRSTSPARSGPSGRAVERRRPAGVRSRRARASNRRCSGGETLLAGGGRPTGADGGHVPVGGPHVPPPAAGPVGVGGRPDAPVVALVPVEAVVPALVARPGPVGDLLPPVAGRGQDPVGTLVPVRPGRRRRDAGPGRRPAGCPAPPSGSRRSGGAGARPGRGRRPGCAPSRRSDSPAPPMIRSMFQVAKPAPARPAAASRARSEPWRAPGRRARGARSTGRPSEIRVTPAAR